MPLGMALKHGGEGRAPAMNLLCVTIVSILCWPLDIKETAFMHALITEGSHGQNMKQKIIQLQLTFYYQVKVYKHRGN